jgi:hypothetical protein
VPKTSASTGSGSPRRPIFVRRPSRALSSFAAVILGIPAQPSWVFGVLMETLGVLATAVFTVRIARPSVPLHVPAGRRRLRAWSPTPTCGSTRGERRHIVDSDLGSNCPHGIDWLLVVATGVAALFGWTGVSTCLQRRLLGEHRWRRQRIAIPRTPRRLTPAYERGRQCVVEPTPAVEEEAIVLPDQWAASQKALISIFRTDLAVLFSNATWCRVGSPCRTVSGDLAVVGLCRPAGDGRGAGCEGLVDTSDGAED